MAKFLLIAWPYAGHVHPSLGLARVLRERGHEVAFYTGAMPGDPIEREGFIRFPFIAVARTLGALTGYDGRDAASLYEAVTERYTATHLRTRFGRLRRVESLYREMLVGTIRAQVDDLTGIVASWGPDAIVSDPFVWAPFTVLHGSFPIPVAVFSFYAGCLVPGPDAPAGGLGLPRPRGARPDLRARLAVAAVRGFGRRVTAQIDRVRRELALPPLGIPVSELLGRMPLHMVCSSPAFDYERTDLPPSVQYVGPCAWDRPPDAAAPAWLRERPAGRPLVYVSEGTAQVKAPVLLRAAVEAARGLDADVVITTGRHRDPAALGLGPLPPNVRVERFIAHSDIFPRARVVVTNGGSNTVRAALSAGVPLVVAPMEWDQLENAQRVFECGAGLRLDVRQITGRRLRKAVHTVIADPAFAREARRIGAGFAEYGDGLRAAELLEALAGGQMGSQARPVPCSVAQPEAV